jgi:hypothetical protein
MPALITSTSFTCATCEAAINGSPTFDTGLPFCCAGCAAGGPCLCSYDAEIANHPAVRYCLDIAPLLESGAERPGHTRRRLQRAG